LFVLSFWCSIWKKYFQELKNRIKQRILDSLKNLCFLKKWHLSSFSYFLTGKKHLLAFKSSFSWSIKWCTNKRKKLFTWSLNCVHLTINIVRVWRWCKHRRTLCSFPFRHIWFFLVRSSLLAMLSTVSIYLQKIATVMTSAIITRLHLIFGVSHLEQSDLHVGWYAHSYQSVHSTCNWPLKNCHDWNQHSFVYKS